MAFRQLDINRYVHAHLFRRAPRRAKSFTEEVKELPAGTPALENIIQNVLTETDSSNVQVQGKVTTESNKDQGSSCDSSSQYVGLKQEKQVCASDVAVNKQAAGSNSMSSDSEENPAKHNAPVLKPAINVSLNENKSSSSDSYSNPDTKIILKPPKTPVKKNLVAERNYEPSSDSSDSEDENSINTPPLNVAAKVTPTSKPSPKVSRKQSSGSSSNSESDNQHTDSQTKNIDPLNVKKLSAWNPAVANSAESLKTNLKSKSSSSVESSESEDEKGVMVTLTSASGCFSGKASECTQKVSDTSKLNLATKNEIDSSDDSSSEDQVTKSNIKDIATHVKNILALQRLNPAVTKSAAALKTNFKCKARGSDDSSDSDKKTKVPVCVKTRIPAAKIPRDISRSRDSEDTSESSDSDATKADSENSVKASQQKKPATSQNTFSFKKAAAPIPSTKSNKDSDSWSDSFSDEVLKAPETKSIPKPNNIIPLTKTLGGRDVKLRSGSKVVQNTNTMNQSSNSSNQNASGSDVQPQKRKTNFNENLINNIRRKPASYSVKHGHSSPFRRVKSEDCETDYRLRASAAVARNSVRQFQGIRGKRFKLEKNKKKKSAHLGKIDTTVKSIKYDD